MKFNELNFVKNFAKLGNDFSQKTLPKTLLNSKIIAHSKDAAQLIDLADEEILSDQFLSFVTGDKINDKFSYLAQAYAGHQFGNFVDILGDGRAILMAEVKNKNNQNWDLVLKGCGTTPYSRTYIRNSDGRAALRSSIREFLISESLFYLGIPSSRALCLIASDEIIMRETLEKAAQIIRLSPSHIRFGTFEYFFYQKQNDKIKILADYAIDHYFCDIKNSPNKYVLFLQKIVQSTAILIAKWQAFGFCHGVMNTDNMSIHGISFDFGPFGFLDDYNPHYICNKTDISGRYSYINQPFAAFWNLNALAITLTSLIDVEEQKEILQQYEEIFLTHYHQIMAAKLGFADCDLEVKNLIYEMLDLLEESQLDYHQFFCDLTDFTKNNNNNDFFITCKNAKWQQFNQKYCAILQKRNISDEKRFNLMNQSNPRFILRNYLLQNAIEKATDGNYLEIKILQDLIKNPFVKQDKYSSYYKATPQEKRGLALSCSS